MKKLLLILLCLPMIFSCGDKKEESKDSTTLPKNIESKEKNFIKYSINDVYWEGTGESPNTKMFLKSNNKIISEGIIIIYKDTLDDNTLTEVYIYDKKTYKYIHKEDNIVRESMGLISGNKWLQKEYYSDGVLEEEEEYVVFNEEWYKNGIEKGYYRTGQLLSEDYNYSSDCGEEPPSFKIYKRYHLNGKLMEEHKYSFEENRLIYEKCWNEDGKIIRCEDEIYY